MKFEIEINASAQHVWEIMLGKETYPIWTKAFSEDSRVETDWQKGSKALFLDGQNRGMVSRIAESIPYQFLSIEHLGMVMDGVEDYESDEVKKWAGAKENYTLTESNGKTHLVIDMEMDETEENQQMIEMFAGIWPKALAILKKISENN